MSRASLRSSFRFVPSLHLRHLSSIFILLLLLFAPSARAQRRPQPPQNRKCLRAGQAILFESQTAKCPCFLHGLFVTESLAPLTAKLYALTPADYEAWRDLPLPKGSPQSRISLPGSTLQEVLPAYLEYGWSTGTIRIDRPGEFKIIALVSSGSAAIRCVNGLVVLNPKPETCPLRLAPPPLGATFNFSTFVVGGTKLDQSTEFSGYNALISTGRGNCTGSLISDQWVLTAAHCKVNNLARVKIGGATLSDGEQFNVAEVINHPLFTGRVINAAVNILNDIALVRLARPVKNANFLQINSNNQGPDPGTIVRATGYGKVTTLASSRSLRMVDIVILSTNECRNRFRRLGSSPIGNGIRDDVHVCIGRDMRCEQGGVCFGDSGGPIVARIPDGSLVQIGVTSYGDTKCGNVDSADVFTRVSHYVEWIQSNTGNAAKPVQWKSVDNVASSGNFGSKNDGASLPLWALVTIIVAACVIVVGVALIVVVFMGRRQSTSDNSDNNNANNTTTQPQVSSNGNQPPPPAVYVHDTQPAAYAGHQAPPVNQAQIPPPIPPPMVPQQAPSEPTPPAPVHVAPQPSPSVAPQNEGDEDRIEEGGLGPRPHQ